MVRGVSGRVEHGERAPAERDRDRRRRRHGRDPVGSHGTSRRRASASVPRRRCARCSRAAASGSTRCGAPALVDPDGGRGVALEQRAGAARVVEVDVRDDDVREVVAPDAERVERRGEPIGPSAPGPRLDKAGLRSVEQVDGVQLSLAGHRGVDRRDAVGATSADRGRRPSARSLAAASSCVGPAAKVPQSEGRTHMVTVNVVVLAGTVAADPVTRRMPSGDEVTELRVSVPEAGRRLLPLPVAAWHATVGRAVLDADRQGRRGPRARAARPPLLPERSRGAEPHGGGRDGDQEARPGSRRGPEEASRSAHAA